MPSRTDTGVAIQQARQRKRLTQRQLAETVGVHVGSVRNWERGTHFPLRYRALVEDALGIVIQPHSADASHQAAEAAADAPAEGKRARGFLSRRTARRSEGDAA